MKQILLLITFLFLFYSLFAQKPENNKQQLNNQLNLEGYIMPLYQFNDESNNFELNYLRLKSKGMITNFLGYFIQFDVAKKPTIKDASIDLKFNKYINLRIGQFKYHFGIYKKPWDFPTIYKPSIISHLFGDPRDIGIQLSGSVGKLDYYAYVMNGTARGVGEDDKNKTTLLSIDYSLNSNLKIGTSHYLGSRNFNEYESQILAAKRNRNSVYFWYDNQKLLMQFESIWGADYLYSHYGHYLIIGYHINKIVQPVFRYDYMQSDFISSVGTKLAGGINFHFSERFYLRSIFEFNNYSGSEFEFERMALELGVMLF